MTTSMVLKCVSLNLCGGVPQSRLKSDPKWLVTLKRLSPINLITMFVYHYCT